MSTLSRELGFISAVMLGLGSILGTGVFVSIGIAAGVTGSSVIIAIILAALLASCNALSSAQLAALHPVSGGTYEYGYRMIGPRTGFAAGWMFLLAKSASAASAAIGIVLYGAHIFEFANPAAIYLMPALIVFLITALVATGLKRSNMVNIVVVMITIASLLAFVIMAITKLGPTQWNAFKPVFTSPEAPALPLLEATALMFVAYTGYGRIATMGEEVKNPRKTIPRAIIATLFVSAALYISVAIAFIATKGVAAFLGTHLPTLENAAAIFEVPGLSVLITIGALTAMLGVLLNLVLGLSRMTLAMARRRDLPKALSAISHTGSPTLAVIAVGFLIAGLTLIGDIKTTWTFSAFTVLIYYSITNLSALRQPKEECLYPRWISILGLIGCLGLAAFVPVHVWMLGLALLVVGWIWQGLYQKVS